MTSKFQARVLVVNDDPVQLHLIASILKRDGFEVLSCGGAEEALRCLKDRGSADVIITDLYMPGIDGWRFCRLLRSSAYRAFNTIPILVVSATFGGADAEELTVQLGADGFLAAPYEPQVLCRSVRDLLGSQRPRSTTTVMIVEPDKAQADALSRAFDGGGYRVVCAAEGADALARFRSYRPQIIVLDYELPDMRGDVLLKAFKEPAAATVVIVLTSDPAAEHAVELLRLGADNYVPKAVPPDYLLHVCQSAARQRALLRVEELLELRTQKLRHSEGRYRNLFESAAVGLVTYSLDGTVIAVNQSFEGLSGRSRDELVGEHYKTYLTPSGVHRAAEEQGRARAAKSSLWVYETEVLRADGCALPAEARMSFLPGRDGQAGLIMAMYRDLSAEKKLQQQRAEFSAMVAHDIRNPVGLILGCISLLLDGGHRPGGELARKCHLRIMDNARLLQSLVNNYLDISIIEAGQIKLDKRPLNLSSLLKNIVQRYGWEADARAIGLALAAPEDVFIEGDTLVLERIFGNLLQNAFKFTPNGGDISISLKSAARQAWVSIHNSGPGIEAEKLPLLFEKFKRLPSHEPREGLGLGLYIVRQLVEAHGGRVEAESPPNEGSRFNVALPLVALADAAAHAGGGAIMEAR